MGMLTSKCVNEEEKKKGGDEETNYFHFILYSIFVIEKKAKWKRITLQFAHPK